MCFLALLWVLGCAQSDNPRATLLDQRELAYQRGRAFVSRIKSAQAFRVYAPILVQVPKREGLPDLGKLGYCEILEKGPVLSNDQLTTLKVLLRFALHPSQPAPSCIPTPAFGFLVMSQKDTANVLVSEECRMWGLQMNSGWQDGALRGFEDQRSDQLLSLIDELFPSP